MLMLLEVRRYKTLGDAAVGGLVINRSFSFITKKFKEHPFKPKISMKKQGTGF